MPYPLRYPLAFDARHLGHVLRLFTVTVGAWYSRHHPGGKTGSVTVMWLGTVNRFLAAAHQCFGAVKQ